MEKFIPYQKLSKKKQKAYDRIKRGDWGEVNPVTKTIPNKKAYRRKEKHRQEEN